jgi:uncharacterized membrane protein
MDMVRSRRAGLLAALVGDAMTWLLLGLVAVVAHGLVGLISYFVGYGHGWRAALEQDP